VFAGRLALLKSLLNLLRVEHTVKHILPVLCVALQICLPSSLESSLSKNEALPNTGYNTMASRPVLMFKPSPPSCLESMKLSLTSDLAACHQQGRLNTALRGATLHPTKTGPLEGPSVRSDSQCPARRQMSATECAHCQVGQHPTYWLEQLSQPWPACQACQWHACARLACSTCTCRAVHKQAA